ncbi:TPA: hypothetical protein ACGZ96_003541 [Elizabethkingia anophelis]
MSSGNISRRTTLSTGAVLNFSDFNTATSIAAPVFVNADTDGETGGFSATITIGGTTTTINLPYLFKITPENKSDLTINLTRKCGAIVFGHFREFMCHNLEADTTADPFTPSKAVHGAMYRWGSYTNQAGRYISQADNQNPKNSIFIQGWDTSRAPEGYWNDEGNGPHDSCPTGHRVPTSAEWQAVIDSNSMTRVGVWDDNGYTSAIYFNNTSGDHTLMLPAAGDRSYNNGGLNGRGASGEHWSSTYIKPYARRFSFYSKGNAVIGEKNFTTKGHSVRCIYKSAMIGGNTDQVQTEWGGSNGTTVENPF